MFEQPVIEPAKFARAQASIAGRISPASLARLAPELYDSAGSIDYRATGFVTPKGQPGIRLGILGEVALRCQRCLGRLPLQLDLHRELIFSGEVDEFGQPEEEDEKVDTLPTVARVDLRNLLEEELLLGLPFSVRHEDGTCRLEPPEDRRLQEGSPFAALAKLRQGAGC